MWPSGIDVPVIWPALLAAVFLAWTQALTWMPYGLPGLRVIVAMLWLTVAGRRSSSWRSNYEVPEPVMLAFLAPQLPLAYLAARFAVARARRGDVPDWRGRSPGSGGSRMSCRAGEAIFLRPPALKRGSSGGGMAGRCRRWWASCCRSSWPCSSPSATTPALVFYMLLGVLLTPPFMAGFRRRDGEQANPDVSDSYGVTPFIATRPLTSAALIAAKLEATIWSTLAAWLLVLVAIPLALTLSGTWPVVIERARRVDRAVGTPRAIAVVLLVISGLIGVDVEAARAESVHRPDRPRMAHQVECVLAPVVPRRRRADRRLDHRQQDVQAALWDALALDPRGSGRPQDVRRCLGRHAPPSQRLLSDRTLVTGAAGLARRRARSLRRARVACLHAAHPALLSRARRDPGHPARATIRGTAGARVESASVTRGPR